MRRAGALAALAIAMAAAVTGCGADASGGDAAGDLTPAEESLVAEWSPKLPGVDADQLITDARAVCTSAAQPDEAAFPQLVNEHAVGQDTVEGQFARAAVQGLCPDRSATVERAVAFDRLMHAPATTSPPATRPPTTAPPVARPPATRPPATTPRPTPEDLGMPPAGASARCRDGSYFYGDPHRGMCDAHGGTEMLYR